MGSELRMMTDEGQECRCHISPPCDWCGAMTEAEVSAWANDGMHGLHALWDEQDEQAECGAATARAEAAEQRAEALEREVAQARAEGAAAIARAELAEFKLRRFLPTESGRRCGSIPPCAGCCRDSSGAKCATPRKAQEAKAAEVETWADLYSRAKVAEAEAARLRAAIAVAVVMLPEWSTGALSHLSPAERAGDAARRALLAAQGAPLTSGPA